MSGEYVPNYSKLSIVGSLPISHSAPNGGEETLREMRGATIIDIGSVLPENKIEGGGLIIDYRLTAGETRRVVFAFNDLALWVEWQGICRASPQE